MKIPTKGTSRFLSREDVPEPFTVTMGRVVIDNALRNPYVLHFAGDAIKPLPLNVSNRRTIVAAYGNDDADWQGKRIEVYVNPDVTNSQGEVVGGIRVRVPKAAPAPAAPKGTEAQHKMAMECFSTAATPERLEACMARSKQLRWEHWQVEEQHAAYHARKRALTRPVPQQAAAR